MFQKRYFKEFQAISWINYTAFAYPDITWSFSRYRSSNTKLKIQSGSKFFHATVHPVQGTTIDRDDDRERSLKIQAPISKWIIRMRVIFIDFVSPRPRLITESSRIETRRCLFKRPDEQDLLF